METDLALLSLASASALAPHAGSARRRRTHPASDRRTSSSGSSRAVHRASTGWPDQSGHSSRRPWPRASRGRNAWPPRTGAGRSCGGRRRRRARPGRALDGAVAQRSAARGDRAPFDRPQPRPHRPPTRGTGHQPPAPARRSGSRGVAGSGQPRTRRSHRSSSVSRWPASRPRSTRLRERSVRVRRPPRVLDGRTDEELRWAGPGSKPGWRTSAGGPGSTPGVPAPGRARWRRVASTSPCPEPRIAIEVDGYESHSPLRCVPGRSGARQRARAGRLDGPALHLAPGHAASRLRGRIPSPGHLGSQPDPPPSAKSRGAHTPDRVCPELHGFRDGRRRNQVASRSARATASARKARPRWLTACFSSAAISAKVRRPVPSARRGRTPGRSRSRRRPTGQRRCGPRPSPSATSSRPSGQRTSATVRKRAARGRGRPSAHPLELGQQLGHVVGVAGVLAGVAGRVHARGPVRAPSTSRPVSSATAAAAASPRRWRPP